MYEIAPLLDDPLHNLKTIRHIYRWAITEMETAEISFGHGCNDSFEESSFLICRALKLPFEHFDEFLDAALTHNEAWLTNHQFYIDERALIPRSYIAELLEEDLAPWVEDPYEVGSVLDLCTGSGCLAILAQGAFPNAAVTGSDISADALEVAKINRRDYGMEETLELVQGDLFSALEGRSFDIILSNPPYVTTASMEALPTEYRHEPSLALAAGADGMDVVRRMLPEAAKHLNDGGFLIVEVGDGLEAVEALFPGLELTWLSVSGGDDQVFMVTKEALLAYFV